MNSPLFKSIRAVLAGFISVAVLSVAMDVILETNGVFPPQSQPEAYFPWMLALALLYRCAFTVAGGYIAARLAPAKPQKHAIILGCIGMVAATLGAATHWDLGNHWYPLALIVTAIPCTWLGGILKSK